MACVCVCVSWAIQTKGSVEKLARLEADLLEARTTIDELTTQKNAAVRKAESLQHDLSKKRIFSSVSYCGAVL